MASNESETRVVARRRGPSRTMVISFFGTLAAMSLAVGAALLGTWLLVALVFRYSSLSAIATSMLAPVYVWLWLPAPIYFYITLFMAALLLWRHRSNITNLMQGKETRIGR